MITDGPTPRLTQTSCKASGPVNIIAQAAVELEILHVVKGDPDLKALSTKIHGGLEPGATYLIRLADPKKSSEKRHFTNEGANVIPFPKYENIDLIKTLSPRIVVLRTINQRIDHLESVIRRSTFELDALKETKKGN